MHRFSRRAAAALLLTSAVLVVPQLAGAQQPQGPPPRPQTRTYFVAADEIDWDFAPTGMDQIRGITIDSARPALRRAGRFGTTVRKAAYREYTDASFRTLKPRTAEWEHLGLLGPVIRGVVGDTLRVVFRNNATKPYSMHPHGVFYDKDSEGTPYRDGTSGKDLADDAVPPGAIHTYVWQLRERTGPGPHDGSSIMWMYHSHVEEGKDVVAGTMGAILVTARDKARADGRPNDIDREFVVNFSVYPEFFSQYAAENVRRQLPWANADSLVKTPEFEQSNFFDSMNGFIWGNMPMLTVEQGERVRWYVMASTTEFDFHTPHWHGNTVLSSNMRMDIISTEPMMMVHADMVPDNPGIWLFHCHVKIHMEGGMQARFMVLPKDPVARAALIAAATPLRPSAEVALARRAPTPAGWRARPDRVDVRTDHLHLVSMGDGMHATMAQTGILYNPSRMASGTYRVRATFTQAKRSEHPEAYGILFGGRDLETAKQSYLYFVITQDGRYLVKQRTGAETKTLIDWAIHSAVRQPGDSAIARNALAVEVGAQRVRFLVNDVEVATLPREGLLPTDGIVGLRINHNLDLHVSGFAMEPLPATQRASR